MGSVQQLEGVVRQLSEGTWNNTQHIPCGSTDFIGVNMGLPLPPGNVHHRSSAAENLESSNCMCCVSFEDPPAYARIFHSPLADAIFPTSGPGHPGSLATVSGHPVL